MDVGDADNVSTRVPDNQQRTVRFDIEGVVGQEVLDGSITLDDIRDGIVSEKTNKRYVLDIFQFLEYCFNLLTSPWTEFLTDFGRQSFSSLIAQKDGESVRMLRKRRFDGLCSLLRDSWRNPIIHLNHLQPIDYITYLNSLRSQRNGMYLSKSSYATHRASLYHLFRKHNYTGYEHEFGKQLSNLFRGFYRRLVRVRENVGRVEQRNTNDGEESVHTNNTFATAYQMNDDSKEPMSVELLQCCLRMLWDYNTCDGVFAHTYLVLTWNLMCRSESTSLVLLSAISWSHLFACFSIVFGHTKTDQTGEDSKYHRHIYANPSNPLVFPVTSLCFYFSCCFNTVNLPSNAFLFPGKKQDIRFSKILSKLMYEKSADVASMGYNVKKIGTHSIRKGSSTYLTSLPGGPPAAAIMIRGAWSMGGVRDTYFRYSEAGDQYVGRCLSMNPVLSVSLAASPPHFTFKLGSADDCWINKIVELQFPGVFRVNAFGKLLRNCLCSLIFHHQWIATSLVPNHVVRNVSYALRTEEVLQRGFPLINVSYPWNDEEHVFSGVPPHVALLQELKTVRTDQKMLIDNFVDRVKEALASYGVNADRMTEHNLRRVLEEFRVNIQQQLQNIDHHLDTGELDNNASININTKYQLHFFKGKWHRVPIDWRFPRCGLLDLWRQWWIGDTVKNVPPLRLLDTIDLKHLDSLPLEEWEMHGRKGKDCEKRRPAYKVMCDMRFVMRYISEKAEETGISIGQNEIVTMTKVNKMFAAAEPTIVRYTRDIQKLWLSVVRNLREGKRDKISNHNTKIIDGIVEIFD